MEGTILDNSKNEFIFKLAKQENELNITLQSTSDKKKYELITTLEKLKELDEEFSLFKNIDRLLKVIKDSLENNQYILKFEQEKSFLNLEIKNIIFDKGFIDIQIPEIKNEIINLDSKSLNILHNFTVHIGDIINTMRDLSKDDNWLECKGQEFDTKKYPKLAQLFGGEKNIPSKWEKGAYLGSQNPPSDGSLNWSKLIKSKTYYGCIRKYIGNIHNGYIYKYDLFFTDNKYSNNWNSTSIASYSYNYDYSGSGSFLSWPSFINDTWIIPYYSYDSSRYYMCLFYCQGDKPNKFSTLNLRNSDDYHLSGKNDIVYGNGYYVISAVHEGVENVFDQFGNKKKNFRYPAIIYNKELNEYWNFKETSKDTIKDPSFFIFINNTFAFCFVGEEKDENNNSKNKYISITYCKGAPTNNWTTCMIVPPDADEKNNPSLAYIAPFWMVFYTCNNTPYISFTENLKGKWETKEARFYDGNSSYVFSSSISQSENIVTLIGKKNDNYFIWYGNSPLGEWNEISCEMGLTNIDDIPDISYSGGEWLSIINSGGNYYLAYKKDSTKPCLPLIQNNGNINLNSYIRAK